MTSPVECLNVTETVNHLREIMIDPDSPNGYPVVEDYCPSSVRVVLSFTTYYLIFHVVLYDFRIIIAFRIVHNLHSM